MESPAARTRLLRGPALLNPVKAVRHNVDVLTPFPGIRVFDGAIDNCPQIIEWLDAQDDWAHSAVQARVELAEEINPLVRSSTSHGFPILSFTLPPLITELNRAVWTLADEYARDFNFSFSALESAVANRYEPGQYYGLHMDFMPNSNRMLSAVVYLNDVDEGGQTEFPFVGVSVATKEGRVVLFPSDYLFAHSAHAPVSQTKYSIAYWVIA